MSESTFDRMPAHKQKALLLLTNQVIDPDAKRMTYDEIAAQCDISTRQLQRWRTQDTEFIAARKDLVESYANEIVSDAFHALKYQLVKHKNVKAAEVLLKSRGMLVDRKEVQADVNAKITDVNDQSNDDLMKELEALKRKLAVDAGDVLGD